VKQESADTAKVGKDEGGFGLLGARVGKDEGKFGLVQSPLTRSAEALALPKASTAAPAPDSVESSSETITEVLSPKRPVNKKAQAALAEAVESGNDRAVQAVLQEYQGSVDVNLTDEWGWPPLLSAACRGNIRVSTLLLEEGASCNARTVGGRNA
jgi:ankyrin repeat protein